MWHMAYSIPVAFWLGAIIGSFLNVCAYRLPRHESIIWPSSHCPQCNHPIAWYDNIPILSYLVLAGRCRHCRAPISWRYPLVELTNAVGYAGIVWWFGLEWSSVVYALLFSALLLVSAIDMSHYIIPNVITLPGILLGVLCAATILPVGLVDSLLGLLLGGGILWVLAWVSPYVFGKEGMGLGDVKLLAMIGAFLGWKPTLLTIMLAAFVGSVVGVGLIALRILRRDQYLPFGPFLALGAVIALFFHEGLLGWYFGLISGTG
jgi:leader peptidase (prepilin peptidase)/N-methyltransferase